MNQEERIAKLRDIIGDLAIYKDIESHFQQDAYRNAIAILDEMEREEEIKEFPEVGDVVVFEDRDDDGDPIWSAAIVHTEMFRDLLILQRPHFILLRSAELERRISEATK